MLTYLVLKCPPDQLERLQARASEAVRQELTFEPDFSLAHADPRRGALCVAMGRHDPLAPARVVRDDHGFVVLNGPATGFDRPSDRPLVEEVWSTLRQAGRDAVFDTLKGNYNLAAVTDDGAFAFSDFAGLYPVYSAAGPGWQAFSNRPMALTRLRSGRAEWDPYALGWLIGQSNVFEPAVPARGAVLVVPGTVAVADGAGLRTAPIGRSVWPSAARPGEEDLPPVDWDEVTHDLIEGFRTVGRHFGPCRLSLTGGKDSRLSLALALAAGLGDRIETFTNGLPGSPEVECAAHVAALAGVRHVRPQPPAEGPEPPFDPSVIWERLRQHAFRFSGMVCPWDGLCGPQQGTRMEITGFGGELYKGGHIKRLRKTPLDDVGIAKALWLDFHQPFDLFGLLSEEMAAHQRWILENWVEDAARTTRLDVLPERFYVENRLTHWNGPLQQDVSGRIKVNPLVSRRCAEATFRLNPAARHRELVHFEVMRRLSPELTAAPFLNDTWAPELRARVPFALAAEPFRSTVPATSRNQVAWQWKFLDQSRAEIAAYLRAHAEAVAEVFDARKAAEIAETHPLRQVLEFKVLLSALMTAIVLGGEREPVRDT